MPAPLEGLLARGVAAAQRRALAWLVSGGLVATGATAVGWSESVWRADSDLLDLVSHVGDVTVHEAWIDTGRNPRWVVADAGLTVPHRRSFLGRWYVGRVLGKDRPGAPAPLTLDAPRPAVGPVAELPDEGSLIVSVTTRIAGFAVLAGLLELLL